MAGSSREEARIFSRVDVLGPLSEDELIGLAERLPDRRLGRGEFVYDPGERGEELFILKEGRVRSYRTGPEGGRVHAGDPGPEDGLR